MKTKQAEHTPTPWELKGLDIVPQGSELYIATALGEGEDTPNYQEAKANAAHIVKCVNAHEPLLKCLKAIRYALIKTPGINVPDIIAHMDKTIADAEPIR